MGISTIKRYERKTQFLIGKAPVEVIERRTLFAQELKRKEARRLAKKGYAEGLKCRKTRAEKLLEAALEKKRVNKCYYRVQHPIGAYIADFYFPKSKLVVELDGGVHHGREEYDRRRDETLEKHGCLVIRFPNELIYKDVNSIADQIEAMVRQMNQRLWK